jgi:hypothetical protein
MIAPIGSEVPAAHTDNVAFNLRGPRHGDVVIQGTVDHGFAVVDAMSQRLVSTAGLSLHAALSAAFELTGGDVWQMLVDGRAGQLATCSGSPRLPGFERGVPCGRAEGRRELIAVSL